MSEAPGDTTPAPLARDKESRFGALAVKLGLVQADDLRRAVDEQTSAHAQGRSLRLGEILVDRGWLKPEDARKILDLQEKKVYPCSGCGRRYNVANLAQGGTVQCRFCKATITVPDLSDLRADESFYANAPAETGSKPAADVPDLVPGYRLEKVLGQGGMGTVHLAVQLSLARRVAIKILSPRLAADPDYVTRFLQEARAVAALQHDNLVRAIDQGQAGPHYFLVMEYAEGENLQRRLRREKRIPEREAVVLGRQICEGLQYALQQGFVHRDIKPSNIVVSPDGRVRICDLGLARPPRESGDSGSVLCTPGYASPEAALGRPQDFRSDMYSLGATLYELVTGSPLFTGPDAEALLKKHVSETPVPPRRLNAALSEGIQRILLRLLAKEPARRYASYDELIAELDGLVHAKPPSEVQMVARRRPGRAVGAKKFPLVPVVGAAIGAIVLLFILSNLPSGSSKPEPKKETAAKKDAEVEEERPAPKEERTEPKKETTTTTTTTTAPTSDPEVVTTDVQSKLDLLIWRINLSGVAAAYCDRMGKTREARDLRQNMTRLETELDDLLTEVRRTGKKPFVPEHFRASDEIRSFQQSVLARVSEEEAARVLGSFVAGLKPGSRARVIVAREGDSIEFEIVFDQRPKELLVITQVADIIPDGGGTSTTETQPKDTTAPAKSAFRDPKERAKDSVRRQLVDRWKRKDGDFARAIVMYLSMPEAGLDEKERAVLDRHFETYDPEANLSIEQHAAAAAALADAMKPLAKKDAATILALGHLGETSRDGIDPGREAASRLGLTVSSDKQVWGAGESLTLYAVRRLLDDPLEASAVAKRSGASVRLSYAAAVHSVRGNAPCRVMLAQLATSTKSQEGRAKRQLEVIAADLKSIGICTACVNGKVECPRCTGTGIVTIPPCSECKGEGYVMFTSGSNQPAKKNCTKCHARRDISQFGGRATCPNCSVTDHKVKCTDCKGEQWIDRLPNGTRLLVEEPCAACAGRGSVFARVARACEACLGLGILVAPASQPKLKLKE